MNCIKQYDIVHSLRGHDTGSLYLVIGRENNRVLLVDGKIRKAINPKKKSEKHLKVLGNSADRLADTIGREEISNKEIRMLLAEYRTSAK